MSDIEDVGSGRDDGTRMGSASTSKTSVNGATPVVQAAAAAATVTSGSTTTVCNTAVAELQTALANFGIMAS